MNFNKAFQKMANAQLVAAHLLNSWGSSLKDDLAAIGSSASAFRLLGKQDGFGSSRGLRSPENKRANLFYDVNRTRSRQITFKLDIQN
jgi:hypothetical protein